MTVYVDSMRAPLGRMKMCHMIADTEDELHAMADKIGVARRWYQGDHYDIAQTKRVLALRYGAQQIMLRQAACMMGLRRRWGLWATPEEAELKFKTQCLAHRIRPRGKAVVTTDAVRDFQKRLVKR